MQLNYVPQLDDYVKWKDLEGWVYFKCDEYITIEIGVKDKTDDHVHFHKKTHCCVLCFPQYWHELEYVKNRRNGDVDEYKSQRYRDADLYA
jgi:hypothetical protein